jgi:hypothetical protein
VDEAFKGGVDDYVTASLPLLKRTLEDLRIEKQGVFRTESGLDGVRLITQNRQQGRQLCQTFYFFGNGEKVYVVTCTALADGGDQLDPLFERTMKTFRLVGRGAERRPSHEHPLGRGRVAPARHRVQAAPLTASLESLKMTLVAGLDVRIESPGDPRKAGSMMKPAIAICLIVAGVFLVALPAISDAGVRADMVLLLQKPGVSNVNIGGIMDPFYRFGCYVAGVVFVGIAIRYSITKPPGKAAARVEELA